MMQPWCDVLKIICEENNPKATFLGFLNGREERNNEINMKEGEWDK